ncbi:MAG: hypothetical protein HOW97_09245 [Catenulispora sp.]|nr:hypothetical protein [Catenulispora sp.]
MRFGKVLAVAIGAGLLIAGTPAVASAASGEFTYQYVDGDGNVQLGFLADPPSRECVTLPEVADTDASLPADSPRNFTDSTAVVFTGPDCDGDYFSLRPFKGYGSERLKLRSVLFS